MSLVRYVTYQRTESVLQLPSVSVHFPLIIVGNQLVVRIQNVLDQWPVKTPLYFVLR